MLNFFSKNTLYIIKRIGKIIGANMKRLFFLTISLTVILLFFSVQCGKPGSPSKETKKKAGKETAEKDKEKETKTIQEPDDPKDTNDNEPQNIEEIPNIEKEVSNENE